MKLQPSSILQQNLFATTHRIALPSNTIANGLTRASVRSTHLTTRCLPRQNTPRVRHFNISHRLNKKGPKNTPKNSSSPAAEDPFDFSTLETDLSKAVDTLKADLSTLRSGGRFNPETVENLRVRLPDSDNAKVKVGDLTQVIPKGRVLNILVGEKDHIKPVTSAIQSSNLSLNAQPDPTGANPLLLVVQIPPPTAESRRAVVAEAAKFGQKASTAVRDARGKHHKKHRAMEKSNAARPDDLFKAAKEMEKIVEQTTVEVKKVVDNAKKALESG